MDKKLVVLRGMLEDAFAQKDLHWMREGLAQALMCLENMMKTTEPLGKAPCPKCNPGGVWKISPARDCICQGRAWMDKF